MTRVTRGLIAVLVVLAGWTLGAMHRQTEPVTPPHVPVTTVPGAVEPSSPNRPSQAAVPVKEVPSPAAPSHAPEQMMWAIGASYLMQYVKNSKRLTFLTQQTAGHVQAAYGFALALLTAAGIHFSITGGLGETGGAAITITGLSFSAFKDIAWQWISQQGAYDLIVSKQGANAQPQAPALP